MVAMAKEAAVVMKKVGCKKGRFEGKGGPQNFTCKYVGVRQRTWGQWVAEIREPKSGVRLWLGSFDTDWKAALAYDKAARRLHGPRAHQNLPNWPPQDSAVEISKTGLIQEENSKTVPQTISEMESTDADATSELTPPARPNLPEDLETVPPLGLAEVQPMNTTEMGDLYQSGDGVEMEVREVPKPISPKLLKSESLMKAGGRVHDDNNHLLVHEGINVQQQAPLPSSAFGQSHSNDGSDSKINNLESQNGDPVRARITFYKQELEVTSESDCEDESRNEDLEPVMIRFYKQEHEIMSDCKDESDCKDKSYSNDSSAQTGNALNNLVPVNDFLAANPREEVPRTSESGAIDDITWDVRTFVRNLKSESLRADPFDFVGETDRNSPSGDFVPLIYKPVGEDVNRPGGLCEFLPL